jgi:hypothetical protein
LSQSLLLETSRSLGRKPVAVVCLAMVIGTACHKDAPPLSARLTSNEANVSVHDRPEGTAVDSNVERARVVPKNIVCTPDTTGVVTPSLSADRLKAVRSRAWAREQTLKLRPEWWALLPSLQAMANAKIVSFEISVGASAGYLRAGFECIRWRILSSDDVLSVKQRLVHMLGLKPIQAGELAGTVSVGQLSVGMGVNGQDVTQVDFALVPKAKIASTLPFGQQSPLVTWLRTYPVVGFEYGVYVSGRKGLKFPGFERAVVLANLPSNDLDLKLKEQSFQPDKASPAVYVQGTQTLTVRRYERDLLSVFWQRRLGPKAMMSWNP